MPIRVLSVLGWYREVYWYKALIINSLYGNRVTLGPRRTEPNNVDLQDCERLDPRVTAAQEYGAASRRKWNPT